MIRRLLLLVLVLVAAVTTFFVFYHPPMRLMPPPLAFEQHGAALLGVAPAMTADTRLDILYATTRLPLGPRDDRTYTVAPDGRVHLGTAALRIGTEETTLAQVSEWSTGIDGGERPFIRLERMAEQATLDPDGPLDPGASAWLAALDASLAASRGGDVIVYVHGANTTVERAAGQAAQLHHFAGRDAVVVLFAWPTAENFLRYSRDLRTALGSAPQLAEFLRLLAAHSGARTLGVFTYSAGATIGSDALALLAREHPEAASRLGQVYHAAPDADFRGFVEDLAAYAPAAGRVTAAVNLGDSALRLAGAVNRASRAGRPDLRELSPAAADRLLVAAADGQLDVVQVTPETMPDLPATSHTFWYDHPWASNDVLLALLFRLAPAERGLEPATAPSGARYFAFPPDYPDRILALAPALGASIAATGR